MVGISILVTCPSFKFHVTSLKIGILISELILKLFPQTPHSIAGHLVNVGNRLGCLGGIGKK